MTIRDPRLLFEMAAHADPDTSERHLILVAAIAAVLERDIVLVGGSAVNAHTGTYYPTDIDLVGLVGPAEREELMQWSFAWAGVGHRHLSYEFPDGEIVLVEFPSSTLDGIRPPEWREVAPDAGVWVIALDDLMMDRLQQATDGSLVTFEAAVSLAVAMNDSIDWEGLEEESQSPGNRALSVDEKLRAVRAAVDAAAPH
ncbi:MAG: hypothetical protein BMS9Abin17_1726 [Acidimicrobiia bacterium]|nr:MAG: hypothetical protein BMS9Abin17_1726 [Acidimicrobiia bacterium]